MKIKDFNKLKKSVNGEMTHINTYTLNNLKTYNTPLIKGVESIQCCEGPRPWRGWGSTGMSCARRPRRCSFDPL